MKLNTKDDVYFLMNSTTQSAALDAAIETGLLWQLAAKPMSAREIAQALSIPGKRCHYWLQVLDELGILQNGTDGYAPSPLAREAILDVYSQDSWRHLRYSIRRAIDLSRHTATPTWRMDDSPGVGPKHTLKTSSAA